MSSADVFIYGFVTRSLFSIAVMKVSPVLNRIENPNDTDLGLLCIASALDLALRLTLLGFTNTHTHSNKHVYSPTYTPGHQHTRFAETPTNTHTLTHA